MSNFSEICDFFALVFLSLLLVIATGYIGARLRPYRARHDLGCLPDAPFSDWLIY